MTWVDYGIILACLFAWAFFSAKFFIEEWLHDADLARNYNYTRPSLWESIIVAILWPWMFGVFALIFGTYRALERWFRD